MPMNLSDFRTQYNDFVGAEDDGQPGVYVIPKVCAPDKAAGVTEVANTAWLVRFRPGRSINVVNICFVTTTAAGANDSCDAAIYNAAGTRVASAGSTAGLLNATAGVQALPLTAVYTMTPGATYYVAFGTGALGGTAAVFAGIALPLSGLNVGKVFGAAYPTAELSTNTAGIPLAATIAAYSNAAVAPLLALREF